MKIWTDQNYPIIISCAKELSRWTEIEVRDLGYSPIEVTENTVVIRGSMRDMMTLNLRLRTAHRVLVPLLRTTCRNIRDLYQAAVSIDWENLLEADGYFSVSSIVHNYTIRDTRLPSLYTKDAIADRMREKCQRRPDSGGENIGAAVFVYWERDEVIIYLDTSGEPLSKRGYRRIPGSAPMQETLAAACLMAMKWDRKTPFLSPMCGSGTPAIEAAMMAMNIAPGAIKSHFAFQSIKGYTRIIPGEKAPNVAPRQIAGATPENIWKELLLAAKKEETREACPKIIATDISPEAVENAHTNAIAAGVAPFIEFKACDFADTPIPVDAKSVRVPVDAESVRVPVDAKSVRVPVDAKSVRVPVDAKSVRVPVDAVSHRVTEENDPSIQTRRDSASTGDGRSCPEETRRDSASTGTIFFNPEYGIRLGTFEELQPVYERIGTFLAEKCAGWTGGLITGNPDLARCVDLYYRTRVPFFNGPIDCRLFIYEGCKRKNISRGVAEEQSDE